MSRDDSPELRATREALEVAIQNHVNQMSKDEHEPSQFVSGWVLFTALFDPSVESEEDSSPYLLECAENQPVHVTVGLLHCAMDYC